MVNHTHSSSLGGCPLRGKSSMCMCLDHTINCYKEPVGHFTHIFVALGHHPVPRWGSAPQSQTLCPQTLRHFHIQLCIYHFRHLAINLICRRAVATSMRKVQRKHRKMWRNATLFMMICCRKKQRTNAKSGGAKVAEIGNM